MAGQTIDWEAATVLGFDLGYASRASRVMSLTQAIAGQDEGMAGVGRMEERTG